jgi:Skp family chaperone for outer membrane proteins
MKWYQYVGMFIALFVAVMATLAFMQPSRSHPNIAFIDLQSAIASCEQGKAQIAELNAYVAQQNQGLQARQSEIQGLQAASASTKDNSAITNKILVAQDGLAAAQKSAQDQVAKMQQNLQQTVGGEMRQILREIAEKKGIDWIVALDGNRDSYVKEELVLNDELVKAYDKRHPVK